jgi:hypothetical protein
MPQDLAPVKTGETMTEAPPRRPWEPPSFQTLPATRALNGQIGGTNDGGGGGFYS